MRSLRIATLAGALASVLAAPLALRAAPSAPREIAVVPGLAAMTAPVS